MAQKKKWHIFYGHKKENIKIHNERKKYHNYSMKYRNKWILELKELYVQENKSAKNNTILMVTYIYIYLYLCIKL